MREKVKMRRRWSCVLLLCLFQSLVVDSSAVLSNCPSNLQFNQSSVVSSLSEDVLTNLCSLTLRPINPNHTMIIFDVSPSNSSQNKVAKILLDGKRVELSKKCFTADCLFFGNHLEVIFNSTLYDFGSEMNWSAFQIGYKVVENTCPTPEVPLFGRILQSGSKLGEKVIYSCDTPFISSTGSLKSEIFCLVSQFNMSDVPMPSWNGTTPSCIIPQCNKTPFRMIIGDSEETMVVNPSYPKAFKWKKNRICTWKLELEDPKMILRVLIESAFIEGERNALIFYDGETGSYNPILSANGVLENVLLSPINNRLTIRLELHNGSALFNIRVWAAPRLCSSPLAPTNGLVQGAIIEDPKSKDQQVVVYSCSDDFYLDGNELSFCSRNGEWNSSTPRCFSSISGPPFFTSSSPNLSIVGVPKNQRPSPPQQSTEEKSRHWKVMVTSGDYSNFTDYSPTDFDEYPEKDAELVDIYDSGVTFADEVIKEEFPVGAAVALGVGIPVALGILGLVGFLVYRKLYPARMTIGRKFGTFENPVYEGSKRNPGRGDSLLPNSSLSQIPAEQQRLTTHGHR